MTAQRSFARADLAATFSGLVLLVLWEASGWDIRVAHWFGTRTGFALQEAWWTRTLVHDGGRLAAYVVLALMALGAVFPRPGGPSRAERWHWWLATLACLVLVPSIKRISTTSCPWDLAEFGGTAAYVPHWLPGLHDGGPGRCFPSGHAVAAFAFFSLYFLWRSHRPAMARLLLACVCAAGLLFGLGQLARGAHFPSHTFWSAWLCWTICVVMARWHGRRALQGTLPDMQVPATASHEAPCLASDADEAVRTASGTAPA